MVLKFDSVCLQFGYQGYLELQKQQDTVNFKPVTLTNLPNTMGDAGADSTQSNSEDNNKTDTRFNVDCILGDFSTYVAYGWSNLLRLTFNTELAWDLAISNPSYS